METESINPADDLSESVIGAVSVVTPEKNSRQQNYNYLPDIRMASCKLCSYQTQGKNACLEMLNHVKVHECLYTFSPVTLQHKKLDILGLACCSISPSK